MTPPPGSFTISFNLDQNLFALGFASVLGVMGLALLVFGLVSLRSNTVRLGLLSYARERTPGAAGLDDVSLREALVTRRHAKAWTAVFGGVGAALAPVVWLGGSWLARGDFLLVTALHGWGMIFSIFITSIVFLAAGQAYGVHRLRARSAGQPVYGNLQPRHLTDFMPRWFALTYVTGLLLLWAEALIVLPFLRVPPTTSLLGGEVVTLPFGRWFYVVTPAAALLVAALSMLLRWMMALPTLRFCPDLRHSAAIDAGFRREANLALLSQSVQIAFWVSYVQFMTILDNTPRTNDLIAFVSFPFMLAMGGGYLFVLVKLALLQQTHLAGARGNVRAT
jgi:hypothetical protein